MSTAAPIPPLASATTFSVLPGPFDLENLLVDVKPTVNSPCRASPTDEELRSPVSATSADDGAGSSPMSAAGACSSAVGSTAMGHADLRNLTPALLSKSWDNYDFDDSVTEPMKKQIELHRDLMDAIQSERPYAGESGNTFLTLPVTAQLMHLDSSAPTPILTPYTNPPSPVTGPRLKRKARSGDDENNADSSSIGGDERAGMAVDAKYDTFPYVINNIDNNLQREGRLALQVATAIHTATSSFTQSASIYIDHPTCGVTAGTSLRIPPEQLILPGLPHQVVLEAPKPSPVQDEHGIPSPEADAPRKKRSYTRRNPATSTKRRKAVTEQDPIPAATSLSDASDATPTRPAKLPRISTISPNTAPDDDASAAAALLKLANALTPSSPTTPTTAPASAPLRRASHTPKIMAHLDSCAAPIPSDDAEEKAWLQQQEVLIETISPPPPDGRKFRCHLCMMTAARRYNIFTHLKTHMEGVRKRKYGCRECGKSFFRFYELERHWERKKHYGILGTN